MKNFLKKIVVFLLAGSVFAWTMFIESGTSTIAGTVTNMKVFAGEMEINQKEKVQTGEGQFEFIRFDTEGVIRLAPSSSLVLKDKSESGYVFELENGRAWVNDHFASMPVRVLAGSAFLEPRRASFDVSFDGEQTKIGVYSSQVMVGLVTGGDPNPINSFLVAEGGQATVSLAKVVSSAELLRKLLYSKLVKEFNYSLMDPVAMGQDQWVAKNLKDDADLLAAVSSKRLEAINARGLKYASLDSPGYQIDKAVIELSDKLTFTEERRIGLLIDSIDEHLLDAEYLLVFGRSTEARERILLYEKLMKDGFALGDEIFRAGVLEKMRSFYNQLLFVLPTDALFEVKTVLSDFLLAELEESPETVLGKLGLIRDYMNYAYKLAQTNQLEARLSLQNYFMRFQDFVKNEKSRLAGISDLLSEENRIMDNLLKQYPQFYQDAFFAMKNFLETEWLKLLPEGNDKNEEKQTMISTKIDFLKQLQSFFLAEKISLADARQVVLRLINEIQALQTGTDIGVSALFALRLKDYGNFLKFLKTTNVSQLRGSSPQKEYEKFLALQREQLTIDQVIKEFLGEEVPKPVITPEQISQQIADDFATMKVTGLQVGEISGEDQELVDILGGDTEGMHFSGRYDWNLKLISQLKMDDVMVSEEPIRLSSLVVTLQAAAVEMTVAPQPVRPLPAPAPAKPEVSQAERVARILLIQKLKASGISAVEDNILVTSVENGEFSVNGATLISNKDIQVSFNFQNKTNVISGLIVKTPAGDLKVLNEYPLAQLDAAATQVYNKAVAGP
ncbi:FecR family protein [Patescibacteria group bacterium]|nr:FecR family protein [Patescibacteria group bacterium]MBU1702782.1 FecR family protein [Patescibacteria group bacterium]MBU1954094.1 FecR family protein [Patescibacteria group bacterium]